MITAVHTLVFAEDPDAARAFFRDVLGMSSADTGGGWCDDREATTTQLQAPGAGTMTLYQPNCGPPAPAL